MRVLERVNGCTDLPPRNATPATTSAVVDLQNGNDFPTLDPPRQRRPSTETERAEMTEHNPLVLLDRSLDVIEQLLNEYDPDGDDAPAWVRIECASLLRARAELHGQTVLNLSEEPRA